MTKGKKQVDGTKRCRIEFGLAAGESKRSISKEIGVNLSTVSREIRKHTYVSFKGCHGRANQCVHRAECRRAGVCGTCPAKGAPCARCTYRNCNKVCADVEYIDCARRLARTAQVCNGCPDERRCHLRKFFYIASRAQEDYRTIVSWGLGASMAQHAAKGKANRRTALRRGPAAPPAGREGFASGMRAGTVSAPANEGQCNEKLT